MYVRFGSFFPLSLHFPKVGILMVHILSYEVLILNLELWEERNGRISGGLLLDRPCLRLTGEVLRNLDLHRVEFDSTGKFFIVILVSRTHA